MLSVASWAKRTGAKENKGPEVKEEGHKLKEGHKVEEECHKVVFKDVKL